MAASIASLQTVILAGTFCLLLVTVSEPLPRPPPDDSTFPDTDNSDVDSLVPVSSPSQKPDVRIDHTNKGSIPDEPRKQEKSITKGHVTKPRDYDDDLFIDDDPSDYRTVEEMVDDEAALPLGSGMEPSTQSVSTTSPSALTFLDAEPQTGGQNDDSIGDLGSGQPMNKLSTGGTKCQLLRNRALAGIQVFYTPECDENGDYKPLQCKDDQCWCADTDGRVIPYTRQRITDKPPDCAVKTGEKQYRVDNDKKKTTEPVEFDVLTTVDYKLTSPSPIPTVGQQTSGPNWLFLRTDILAGIFVGTGVGLICAVILVICIVHRMKKKDEGSYVLDEPLRPPPCPQSYQRAPTKEVYA